MVDADTPDDLAAALADSEFFDAELLDIFESIDEGMNFRSPTVAVYLDIVRVAEMVGHPPKTTEYNDHGNHGNALIIDRFSDADDETWQSAMRNLGYDYESKVRGHRPPTPDDVLREDVQRVVDELGHAPSSEEYVTHGNHGRSTVADRFGDGSWPAAMRNLGYDYIVKYGQARDQTSAHPHRIDDDVLRGDVARVAEQLGHVPSWDEYNDNGAHRSLTVLNRLGVGSWEATVESILDGALSTDGAIEMG